MRLRERGIYCLPNGRELIVIGSMANGNTKLCGCQKSGASDYELDSAGRLLTYGRLTAWDITNLADTGRTAGVISNMFPSDSEHRTSESH